jgi:hypothetical protein
MKNEILEEVWRARDKIFAECDYDLKKLVTRKVQVLPALQKLTGHRAGRPGPRQAGCPPPRNWHCPPARPPGKGI